MAVTRANLIVSGPKALKAVRLGTTDVLIRTSLALIVETADRLLALMFQWHTACKRA
jgi:hypothetical protein